LKFSDVITAAAVLIVINTVVTILLLAVFTSAPTVGWNVAPWVSILVASLIGGYIFALKIQEESKTKAISSIALWFSFATLFAVAALFANPLVNPYVKDNLSNTFSTTGWTDYNWVVGMGMIVVFNVVFAFVLGFIGLYAGSMLRKPSARTKE
jgi:hypothetical protein